MNTIKEISRINDLELEKNIPLQASWHQQYSHSSYIVVTGLNFEMNEGDIVIVFSQCGEVVDCRLARDHLSGKSRGFAFICYEDQRSTILAVDNFNGSEICGRIIKVDHVDKYRPPKEYLQVDAETLYTPTGPDGRGWGKYRRLHPDNLIYKS